jgi:hypothetical protein
MRVTKLLTVLLTLFLVIGLSLQATAGNPNKKGTAGAEELLIPMGARGTALAGAAAASISGIDAIYWNPAGLANTQTNVQAMFSYMTYIADINIAYGAVGVKTALGSIGVSFQSLAFGDIAITTEDAPDGTGSFYSPTYMTVGATYSRAMTDRIYVGVNMKFIHEAIMQTQANTFALDMGVQYLTDLGIRLGVLLKNFGAPIRFDGENLDRQVDLPDVPPGTPQRRLRFPAQKAELPSSFEIALAYDVKPIEKFSASVMASVRTQNFMNDQLLAGLELGYNDMFFVRGGYDYGFNEGEDIMGNRTYLWGPTFGFGLNLPITGTMKLAFDFAYRLTMESYFDNNMLFTAKFIF